MTVDKIASDIASSLSPMHLYDEIHGNGALPSLPLSAAKPDPHCLKLPLRRSGSFDGKLSYT